MYLYPSCSESDYSDSEEEEWAGLSPVPLYDEDDFGTPAAAATRRGSGMQNAAAAGAASAGAAAVGGSSRKATTPGGGTTPAGGGGGGSEEGESWLDRVSRTCRRYYRFGKAVVVSVKALLAIKTYRYLLGGETYYIDN